MMHATPHEKGYGKGQSQGYHPYRRDGKGDNKGKGKGKGDGKGHKGDKGGKGGKGKGFDGKKGFNTHGGKGGKDSKGEHPSRERVESEKHMKYGEPLTIVTVHERMYGHGVHVHPDFLSAEPVWAAKYAHPEIDADAVELPATPVPLRTTSVRYYLPHSDKHMLRPGRPSALPGHGKVKTHIYSGNLTHDVMRTRSEHNVCVDVLLYDVMPPTEETPHFNQRFSMLYLRNAKTDARTLYHAFYDAEQDKSYSDTALRAVRNLGLDLPESTTFTEFLRWQYDGEGTVVTLLAHYPAVVRQTEGEEEWDEQAPVQAPRVSIVRESAVGQKRKRDDDEEGAKVDDDMEVDNKPEPKESDLETLFNPCLTDLDYMLDYKYLNRHESFHFAVTLQQLHEAQTAPVANLFRSRLEVRARELAASRLRQSKEASAKATHMKDKKAAETEEQKGWTEETCDMTDAVREETLKEKRAAFEKEWKEKWEALVEEHKPSDAAEPRQLDQTLATFIGYLAQSNQIQRRTLLRQVAQQALKALGGCLSRKQTDFLLSGLESQQATVGYQDLLQVEPSKLLPVEQWKAKVLKAPEPVKAAEPTAAAASPAAEAAAEPVAAVDAEEAEAAEEEAKDEAAEPAAEEGDAPAEGGDYSTMSYRELQAACKEKGLPASGTKDVLQKRLSEN